MFLARLSLRTDSSPDEKLSRSAIAGRSLAESTSKMVIPSSQMSNECRGKMMREDASPCVCEDDDDDDDDDAASWLCISQMLESFRRCSLEITSGGRYASR